MLTSSGGNGVYRKEEVEMASPAFKSFLAHVQVGKDVPMSDVDDGRLYALHLHGGAFASDADDADGGRPMHAHTEGTCASFRTWKCSLTGG